MADVHAAYLRQSNLSSLYTGFLHPNETGYQVMAQEFFRGTTQPVAATTAALPSLFASFDE